jgi:putative two-component system response regulator
VPELIAPVSRPTNIMAVDDNPANFILLEALLNPHGYQVRSFPRGRLAIAAAGTEAPDLILLDIDMPEMNGYEVCGHLKSNTRTSGIPVIFLSALNSVEDKIKAFQAGGVDYISKAFQFDELEARVETHVKLRRAQQAEHDLLEKTLEGAVRTLWELLQLSSPSLAIRSRAVRDIMEWVCREVGVPDRWQCEIAATLCLIGCIALPDEVVEKAYFGQPLTADDERIFKSHPEGAARLLSNIPQMEVVAEIILGQIDPDAPFVTARSRRGAQMLNLALETDRLIYRGGTARDAARRLRLTGRFDEQTLNALERYSPVPPDYEIRQLPIHALRPQMVLEQDVCSRDGKIVILKAGAKLTETWIECLGNFARTKRLPSTVGVRVPCLCQTNSLKGV